MSSQIRVLMPQRFDVLSRAMDTGIVDQWLALGEACDLVLWGPGLPGFEPGRSLDEVAEDVDADVVLLPDLHHAIPDLWTTLWAGVERVRRPVVWYLADIGSAVVERRAVWQRVCPAGVLLNFHPSRLTEYADLRDGSGARLLIVQLGYDSGLFRPPAAGTERDIDVLVCGADQPERVYPHRGRVKAAARSLADARTIVDLSHPGYWEMNAVAAGRGQAQFADLLRRSKLVTIGSAFGSLARKHLEAPACGAIGVGDLPLDEPDADRVEPVSLVIDPAWDVGRIAAEVDSLLGDRPRLAALSAAAPAAVSGCDHAARAHEYVAALEELVPARARERRPRPLPVPRLPLRALSSPDPAAVPSARADWLTPGEPRSSELCALLDQSQEDICVLALDPDAARNVDALLLAGESRSSGAVVVRPATDAADAQLASWALVSAPRAALLDELSGRDGRFGLEEALLVLGDRLGWRVLPGGAYADVACDLARLSALVSTGAAVPRLELEGQLADAWQRARSEGREEVAVQLLALGQALGPAADQSGMEVASPSAYCIRDGYVAREQPQYFVDNVDNGLTYQPDVYVEAVWTAGSVGARRVIDVGCGNAGKLVPLHPSFEIVGIDFGENLETCRVRYPWGTWIEHDLDTEHGLPLSADELEGSVIVCADVIEHVLRPERLLSKLRGALDKAGAVLLSTPERDLSHGPEHMGPPPNLAHVREWNQAELAELLEQSGFEHGSVNLTRSHDQDTVGATIFAKLFPTAELAERAA